MEGKVIAFILAGIVVGAAVGVGAGYLVWNEDVNDEENYNFYLHFAASDARNGWYSASANNTNDAFNKAMENAGFEVVVNSYGYIASINGTGTDGWYLCQYLYENTDSAAADASIMYPEIAYGTLTYSNGWKSMSGYDTGEEGLKLSQFSSNIYFFTPYASDYSAESPVSVTAWMGTGPFAAA